MNSFRSAVLGGKNAVPANPIVGDKHGRGADGTHLTSVDIPRDETRSTNHRDEDRHRLTTETATILFKRRHHEVELINLSGGGAMIATDAIKPKLWDRIDLTLGEGGTIECAVRWLRGGRIGLEFAHETHIDCAPEERDALLLAVIQRSFPDIVAHTHEAPEAESTPISEQQAGRRVARRHPLIWNGELFYNHDHHTVRLRNISSSGALIDCDKHIPVGAEVMLDLGTEGQHFATVGWTRGGQCGLSFAKPFDLSHLVAARPDVAARGILRANVGDASANVPSPWAEEWQRGSLEELREDLEGYLKR